ncbi:MAG: hypothetical protein AAFY88_09235, partial [Acidobacteriota bacterium]
PYRYPTSTPEVMAEVQESAVVEPSRAVIEQRGGGGESLPPRHWSRTLEGDLDSIVLRALAKDSDQRYPTVPALGEDLRRFLEGERLAASEPGGVAGFLVRLSGFLRPLTVLVTVALSVLLGILVGSFGPRADLEAAEQKAERAARMASDMETVTESIADLTAIWGGWLPRNAHEWKGELGPLDGALAGLIKVSRGIEIEREVWVLVHLVHRARLDPERRGAWPLLTADARKLGVNEPHRLYAALSMLAYFLSSSGLDAECVAVRIEALVLAERTYGVASRPVLETLEDLADAEWEAGIRKNAIRTGYRALEISPSVPTDGGRTSREVLAIAQASRLATLGRRAEAFGLLQGELESGITDPGSLVVSLMALRTLAEDQAESGELAAAAASLELASRHAESQGVEDDRIIGSLLGKLAEVRGLQGRSNESRDLAERSCALLTPIDPEALGHRETALRQRICGGSEA